MTDDAYHDFKHRAIHNLITLNKHCEEVYKISKWERWDYDLDAGTLIFSESGTPRILAEVQAVGTTSARSKTWLWGWANESLTESVTNRLSHVREFGLENAIEELTEPKLPDAEDLGWELSAVTAALVQGKGGYRCPSDDGGYLYFVYTSIALADLPSTRE